MRPTLRLLRSGTLASRKKYLLPIVLLSGTLLSTLPGQPAGAADSSASRLRMLTDFTPRTYDLGWRVVENNATSDRSSGHFHIEQGALRFTGITNSIEGGFSSVRTHRMRLDLSNFDGVRLHAKADGRRYTWRITTANRWRGEEVSYWAEFEASGDTMTVVDIPFSAFVAKYRGFELGLPKLDPTLITGMGLMIYDRKDGPFEFHLGSVEAYAEQKHRTMDNSDTTIAGQK